MEARNIAFYKFIEIQDPQGLCERLGDLALKLNLKGTLLIAVEGINGMLAGSPRSVTDFEFQLRKDHRFTDLLVKESFSKNIPFQRLRVKVKDEILTLGLPEINPTR